MLDVGGEPAEERGRRRGEADSHGVTKVDSRFRVDPSERSLVHQRHPREGLRFGEGGSEQAPLPAAITEHPEPLGDGTDRQAHVHLGRRVARRSVRVTQDDDVRRRAGR